MKNTGERNTSWLSKLITARCPANPHVLGRKRSVTICVECGLISMVRGIFARVNAFSFSSIEVSRPVASSARETSNTKLARFSEAMCGERRYLAWHGLFSTMSVEVQWPISHLRFGNLVAPGGVASSFNEYQNSPCSSLWNVTLWGEWGKHL